MSGPAISANMLLYAIKLQTNSTAKKASNIFVDKEGNKLGNILFDVDALYKEASKPELIKKVTTKALEYLKADCRKFTDIKEAHQALTNMLDEKKYSADALAKLKDSLSKILDNENKILDSSKNKNSSEHKQASKKYDLVDTLYKLLFYVSKMHLENSSKNVLKLSESGTNKYPERHSFFASALQEVSGYGISELLASVIKKGESIETALLKIEKNYARKTRKDGKFGVPEISTHRLSKHSTKDKSVKFEVLFITGSVYGDEAKNKFTKGEEKLSQAIQKTYGVKPHVLREKGIKEIKEKIAELAAKIRNNGGKLYIVYTGHGGKDGLQSGVSKANSKKQGAEKFIFVLNKNEELDESTIKEIHKSLSDIEIITIFDSCHGGAGITAIEQDKFKSQFIAFA